MYSVLKKIYLLIINNYYFKCLLYEIKYVFSGAVAIAEDIHLKHLNKCEQFDQTGKVALVTGGARGIGLEIVKKLLQCNFHVIIGCRNVDAAQDSLEKFKKNYINSGTYEILALDLSSLNSIKHFSERVILKTKKLHVLVNNAGIMFPPFKITEDGFESQWEVNYLGPFYLTHLLYPLMKETSVESECRIINVSSCAHKVCHSIDYSILNNKARFITGEAYANSKAAQISFTYYLSRLLRDKKVNISVFAVHPGIVNTDLFNGTGFKLIMPWVLKYLCKSSSEGATSVFNACVSPKLSGKTGKYLSNCRPAKSSNFTKDLKEQETLFLLSLDQLKIKNFCS